MNKKAFYALMLALLLPLVSYFVVKHFSEETVVVPGHYLPDSVTEKVVHGKRMNDTQWHVLPDFSLTNQYGKKVSWS